jgi:hypothetical protein
MNARRHPRTMREAFGPYTSDDLHPMQRQRETSSKEIVWYIVGLCVVLLIVTVVAR